MVFSPSAVDAAWLSDARGERHRRVEQGNPRGILSTLNHRFCIVSPEYALSLRGVDAFQRFAIT